jgi:hypothetical protein
MSLAYSALSCILINQRRDSVSGIISIYDINSVLYFFYNFMLNISYAQFPILHL